MPLISTSVSVPANSQSGNVLAGSPFEFVGAAAIIRLAATQAGAAASDLTMDFQIGGESVAVSANTPFKAAMPQFNDDTLVQAGATQGERLFLNFNNTTIGALVVQVLIDVMPI